jgi:hypothetical protein
MWTELHASQSQKINYPPAHVPPIFTFMQLLTYYPPFLNYILLLQLIFLLIVFFFPVFTFSCFFSPFYIFALMLSSDSSSGSFPMYIHNTLSVPTI